MRWIGTTISSVTIAGLAVALFLWVAMPLLREPPVVAAPVTAEVNVARTQLPAMAPAPEKQAMLAGNQDSISPASASGTRLLEIFGQVSDTDGNPLEDVLVTEERYFSSVRSDDFGQFRLLLELPRQRLPIIHFLRAGYRGERIHLTWAQLADRPVYGIDIELADSADSLGLDGWVGSDNGNPLEGARVTIKSVDTNSDRLYYLTVFSDEHGRFRLDGVLANARYHLTVTLAPQYPVYSDPDFHLGSDTKPLEIVLKSLQFVTLGGMVLRRDGTPVAGIEFYIKNLSTGLHARKIVSDSSGFFALENFPLGEVVLTTRGAEFFRITGLEITAQNYSNLELVVDRGDRYLDGWVSDVSGLPLEKVMVTLETRSETGGVEYFSYRSQTTDASGRFEFADISGGEHRISAYASGFDKLELKRSIGRSAEPLQLVLTRPY